LFSFEKMAVRDAVRTAPGARRFSEGLHAWLHGRASVENRFGAWCEAIAGLPRRQTRVLTWPVVTVFGFLAQPDRHMFLKPNVTRLAAARYGFDFDYRSRPNWTTYSQLLDLAAMAGFDQRDLRPRDLIDVQFCGFKALKNIKAAASGRCRQRASPSFRSAQRGRNLQRRGYPIVEERLGSAVPAAGPRFEYECVVFDTMPAR
jgi:hypothetical protein